MTASARQELRADVGTIEQAAAAHQLQATTTALARLRSDIAQLEANGGLTTSEGTKVLRAAAAVQADVDLVTTTTTTTSTTTTTTTPPGPGQGKDHGHGSGNGRKPG